MLCALLYNNVMNVHSEKFLLVKNTFFLQKNIAFKLLHSAENLFLDEHVTPKFKFFCLNASNSFNGSIARNCSNLQFKQNRIRYICYLISD